MARAIYKGQELNVPSSLMLSEILYVERHLGVDLGNMGQGTSMAIDLFIALRRTDPVRYTWQAFENLSLDDFTIIPDEKPEAPAGGEDEVDPTGAGEVPASQELREIPVTPNVGTHI